MGMFKKKNKGSAPKGFVSEPTITETVKDQNDIVFGKMNLRERESVENFLQAKQFNNIALKQNAFERKDKIKSI